MATNEARDTDASSPSPAWDRDPIVVASRRPRVMYFPAKVLLGEPSAADLKKWHGPEATGMDRGDVAMRIEAGITFLGAFTTQWMLRGVQSMSQAPKVAPGPDLCTVLWPTGGADNTIRNAQAFKVPETKDLNPVAINAAWCRVFKYLRDQEKRVLAESGEPSLALFATLDGFDAPEVVITKLSDILGQRTQEGQWAHPHMSNAIAYAKNGAHLGALHDYAVRTPGAWSIVESCRAQAVRRPGLVAA